MGSRRYAHLSLLQRRASVIGLFLLALVLPASANAAASTGAVVLNAPTECETIEAATLCASQHFVTNFTSTPSGQMSAVVNGRGALTITSGSCSSSSSINEHAHSLEFLDAEPGIFREASFMVRDHSAVSGCGFGSFDCVATTQFHLVGDVMQFDRGKVDCATP
jgi:hypothetical protein